MSFQVYMSLSMGYMLRSVIPRWQGKYICKFDIYCQIGLYSACTNSHSHQEWMYIPHCLTNILCYQVVVFFFSFYQRYREWWHLDFFILAFLFMNEHHCIRVRAIWMSFSVNFLWTFFACFSFGSLIFFLQTSRNSVFGEISHFQWCDFQILFLVHYLCFNLQHFGHVEDSVLIFR